MAEVKKTEMEVKKTETEVKKQAAKEEMVRIKLPRLTKNDEDVFVSVNERTWLIKRGVEVEVPACVAEVLRHKEEMEQEAYAFDSEVQK